MQRVRVPEAAADPGQPVRGEVEGLVRSERVRDERQQIRAEGLTRQVRRLDEGLIHREQERHLQQDRQAAHRGVVAALLVQLHLLLAQALLVAAVLRLELGHRRRKLLHRALVLDLDAEQRIEREPDRDRQQNDREAEVVDEVVEENEQRDQRMDEQEVPVRREEVEHLATHPLRDRVVAAACERVARQHPPDRQHRAAARAIALDGLDRVLGAGR